MKVTFSEQIIIASSYRLVVIIIVILDDSLHMLDNDIIDEALGIDGIDEVIMIPPFVIDRVESFRATQGLCQSLDNTE